MNPGSKFRRNIYNDCFTVGIQYLLSKEKKKTHKNEPYFSNQPQEGNIEEPSYKI
jgi:hypothetical protein